MPSAPKAPPPINVAQTTETAHKENLLAGQQSQALSTISQDNPYGTLNYSSDIDPITGLPKYKATTKYSPEQQAILDLLQSNQTGIGGTASSAIGNMFGQYTDDPNLVGKAGSLTNQALDAQLPAWERFDAPARAQLDTHLRNQGILPGKGKENAYQQQMDALTNQQGLTRGQWLANFQPQAFQESKEQYQLPLENVAKMLGLSQPGSVNQNLINTPQGNVGAVDVAGLTTSAQEQAFRNYQMKVASQNALMSGIMGGVGGVAKLPANSVGGGMISNMFV